MPQRCRTALAGFLAVILAGLALPASAEASTSVAIRSSTIPSSSRCSRRSTSTSTTPRDAPRGGGRPDGGAVVPPAQHCAPARAERPTAAGPPPPRPSSSRPTWSRVSPKAPAVSPRPSAAGCAADRRHLRDLDHVLGHELVHAFQYDITGGGSPNTYGAMPGAPPSPLVHRRHGRVPLPRLQRPPDRDVDAGAMEDTLPSYRDLLDPRFFPYRYGQALLAYVAGAGATRSWATCFGRGTQPEHRPRDPGGAGDDLDQLVSEWHKRPTRPTATPGSPPTRPSRSAWA